MLKSNYKKGVLIMRKITFILTVAILSLFATTANAQSVRVKIPSFYTEINRSSVDNRYVEYPLILYKDITYFPMTYDMCQSLNLMCGFSSEEGLFITSQITEHDDSNLKPYGGTGQNSYNKYYQAVVAEYPIHLNGIRIYNQQEEYPLLNFRGVTYFPMTYRFACEELNFEIEWSSEEYSFKLSPNYTHGGIWPQRATSEGVELVSIEDVCEPSYDENGNENGSRLLYQYQRNYLFDIENKTIIRKPDSEPVKTRSEMYTITPPTPAIELTGEIKDNAVYVDGMLLMQFPAEENVTGAGVYKTDLADGSLIRLVAYIGDSPAPYYQTRSYLIEKKGDTVRPLSFDKLANLGSVYDFGGNVCFINSSGYRPLGMGRWSNIFSDIYVYDKATGNLTSMAEMKKDSFNSIDLLGYTDGKLYAKAMWYDSNKERPNTGGAMSSFNAVTSGFYEIDTTTLEMKKIYPYIRGEAFVFPDGKLYSLADYSQRQRLINLCTGEIYHFE